MTNDERQKTGDKRQIDDKSSFAIQEERILDFWRTSQIFEKTFDKSSPKGDFVFWEGPPTANGRPGTHHVLARTFKDVIPRYKTMQGYRVIRKAGWDTHGLPVELEVEKQLKISGKKQIENIVEGDARASIIEFNRRCRESVWKYKEEWEQLTERIGFWLDLNNPYVTYDNDFIETVWWILSRAEEHGLLVSGYKSVPYCPRCGTTLSSHEVALGYKENTEDPSIFIKFELVDKKDTAILAWTTTPWTLPGNVALAIDPKEKYAEVKLKSQQSKFILAEMRLDLLEEDYELIREFYGSELVGLKYKPLYVETDDSKAYQIVAADFVSMDDGTGIVHIAPAFGQEDFELGQKLDLPLLRTIDDAGIVKSKSTVPGQGKFVKDADDEIIKDLGERELLFRVATIRHTYPFCWRCDTPLIYLARDSWYIKMSTLRDDLIKRNQKIDWVPDHLREGRFGEWLKEVKDWAISRDRYWGTPLPIWICEQCKERRVIGSVSEFASELKDRNRFLLVRHGEAENNVRHMVDSDPANLKLTAKGREEAKALAKKLAHEKVTRIITSPVDRCREMAKIVAEILNLPLEEDPRLWEIRFGVFNGQPSKTYHDFFNNLSERWTKRPHGGETWQEVGHRMKEAIAEYNGRFKRETIAVVSHGDPLLVLEAELTGKCRPEQIDGVKFVDNADFHEVPVNIIDLHRPYVDDLTLKCACGGIMRRVAEVGDVWLDSSSMPYAQWHWRGEGPIGPTRHIDISTYRHIEQYPADYISEAIDQTRGWFYTLLATATFLEPDLPKSVSAEPPYRHVISLGHLLDSKGQKMSKSKGNVIDPWQVINQYGADALRLHLITMNQPGDVKRFDPSGVGETMRRTLMLLFNVANYWQTYQINQTTDVPDRGAKAMDQWLRAYAFSTGEKITNSLEKYDLFSAGRAVAAWIGDLSTWYVRRSRGRTDQNFFETLKSSIRLSALWLAPFCPFAAESLWKDLSLTKEAESVHLADWPTVDKEWQDEKLLNQMDKIRDIAVMGHAERNKKGRKLRQPLARIILFGVKKFSAELEQILLEELNVKGIEYHEGEKEIVALDTELTPALIKEGLERELARQIQALRKEAGLQVGEQATMFWKCSDTEMENILKDPKIGEMLPATEIKQAGNEDLNHVFKIADKEIYAAIVKSKL